MKISIEFTLEELDLIGSAIVHDRDNRALPAAGHGDNRTRLLTSVEEAAVPVHQTILQKIEMGIMARSEAP